MKRLCHFHCLGLLCFLLLPMAAQSVEFQWQNEAGETQSLASYQGKPVLLHFWASWCPPCRSEMPDLVQWMKENPNVEVVIISLDDDQADAKAFLKQHGMNLPANMANMRDMSALAVRGLPASIVIDRNSNVAARYMGDLQWLDASVSAKVLLWF
ncbi:MAG: hypothetical protein AUK35_01335 [Zetaproteobacteria bacterium CG2_30_46_52]|nr:MAG: hypothetical protein AUK35_01335 [Zetaproteobacteria bacterium CG2_30_46_52]